MYDVCCEHSFAGSEVLFVVFVVFVVSQDAFCLFNVSFDAWMVHRYSQDPKLAHQQAWQFNNETGHFALRADTTLCLAVEKGCPHASSGCLELAACDGATVGATLPSCCAPDTNLLRGGMRCVRDTQ